MIRAKKELTFGKWSIKIPGSPLGRRVLGIALVIGGILGFLPVLGFWMIPLGLFVLSIDLPMLRKQRRKWEVKMEHKKRAKQKREEASEDKKDAS